MQLLTEISREGAGGYSLSALTIPTQELLPDRYLRKDLNLPQVSEMDITKEFMERANTNISVDDAKLFCLGSCTMGYTPDLIRKIHLPFLGLHPLQPEQTAQGAFKILHNLERILSEFGGAEEGTLHPAAGAHSELTAIYMIEKYHRDNCEGEKRKYVVIPDSSHGTNPATATMAGYAKENVVSIPTDKDGSMDYNALKEFMNEHGDEVAALMITQPNTFGIYDKRIKEITELMHEHGAKVFCDGANFAALTGRVRFADLGVDIWHFNLHKTFGVPHVGGGPGAGYVGATSDLVPYLPGPRIVENEGTFSLEYNPKSIGAVSSAFGNFLADVRSLGYILALGQDGFREASGRAVLAANYLFEKVKLVLPPAFDVPVAHEFVVLDIPLQKYGLTAGDFAKGLIDRRIYPTVNFPHASSIVRDPMTKELLYGPKIWNFLIEPTFNPKLSTLDDVAVDFEQILKQAQEEPDWLKYSPYTLSVGRVLDEADAWSDRYALSLARRGLSLTDWNRVGEELEQMFKDIQEHLRKDREKELLGKGLGYQLAFDEI